MSILRDHFLNISSKFERFLPAQPCVQCGSMSQDDLWCRSVAQELGLQLVADACRRVRGAFVCDTDLSGKSVALVDDVMTTGASLSTLADALLRCDATEISTWVVTRTLPHNRKIHHPVP